MGMLFDILQNGLPIHGHEYMDFTYYKTRQTLKRWDLGIVFWHEGIRNTYTSASRGFDSCPLAHPVCRTVGEGGCP